VLHHAPGHAHVAQFLVCRNCHRVAEIDDPALNRVLAEKSRSMGFRIEPTSLEIKGLCSECAVVSQHADARAAADATPVVTA